MKLMKLMACAALAAALAVGVAGCGSKESESSSAGKGYAQPKVAEGAVAAIVARPPEDTSLAQLCKQHGLTVADLMKQVPPDFTQDAIKELELDKAQIKWIAVTVDAVSAEKIEKDEVDFAVAIATSIDLDKYVAFFEKKIKEEGSKDEIKKTTIADVPAYIGIKGEKPEMSYMANLDKQLILVARTSAGLEKLIALYRDGKGASADFGSFTLGANDILRAKAVKVGENLKTAGAFPMFDGMGGQMFFPDGDGDKVAAGLSTAEIVLGASGDGKNVKLDISMGAAADDDAEKIRKGMKNFLALMAAGITKQRLDDEKDAVVRLANDALASVKIAGEGKEVAFSASVASEPALMALGDFLANKKEKAKEIK